MQTPTLRFQLDSIFKLPQVICALLLISSAAFGQSSFTDPVPGVNKEWIVPQGVTSLIVEVWGAGGGGGNGDKIIITAASAGGGGGGGYSKATVSVKPNDKIYYNVGLGGSVSKNQGISGESSSFLTVSAEGGSGGLNSSITASNGKGGIGGTVANYKGGNGSDGDFSFYGGGGGSSAGTAAVGNAAFDATGASAPAGGGSGGNGAVGTILGILLGKDGSEGSSPGGGGGGAYKVGLTNQKGGKGGNGLVVITYDCPASAAPLTPGLITPLNIACANLTENVFTIAAVAGATSYIWSVTGAGWSVKSGASETSATITIGSSPGTVSVKATNACGISPASKLDNLSPTMVSTPTIEKLKQPDCEKNTGSVLLTSLPTSGWWALYQNEILIHSETGGSGSYTVSSLSAASSPYKFTVSNGICRSAPSAGVVIKDVITNIWNLTDGVWAWSNVIGPTDLQSIVFNGSYNSIGDLVGCNCTVKSGNVIINSGHTLTLNDELKVEAGGAITFENNASLVQINDAAVNIGSINYKRHTKAVKRYDFTYWSSPVAGQTLYKLSPNTLGDKYFSYNSTTNSWIISYNGIATMAPGSGYLIRAPQTFDIHNASIDSSPIFNGVPNNGVLPLSPFTLTPDKFYLLGNPYPSALDAVKFLTDNVAALEGTLYFWTHNSPPSSAVAGPDKYNYTSNDYAAYNRSGGVATAATVDLDSNDPNDNNNLNVPTGKIASGQGFFARASSNGGSLVFNNSMRLVGGVSGVNNSQFYKDKSGLKNTSSVEKNRVWLNLTNSGGAFKQLLVGYITGATDHYEGAFDGASFDGNDFVDFYSITQDRNLAIQGRSLPFEESDAVPLGYKTTISGEFTISIDQTDGILTNQIIYLEDKTLATTHNLKESAYKFTTAKGIFNGRFMLRYVNKTLGTEDFEVIGNQVVITTTNKEIKITAATGEITSVLIYDVSGKQIYRNLNINKEELIISTLISSDQVLLIKLELQDKKTITEKIIF